MGSFFSVFSNSPAEAPKPETPVHSETRLFGSDLANNTSTPNMDTIYTSPSEDSAVQDAGKRKRPDSDESKAPFKAARRNAPTLSPSEGDADEPSLATPLSPHNSKRKRLVEDEEHGACAKAARTSSPVNAWDAYDSDRDKSPSVLKRKRSLHENEHGSPPKAARVDSSVSSDADDRHRGVSGGVLKRKRSRDNIEHGALSKAARIHSPVLSSEGDSSPIISSSVALKRGLSDESDDSEQPSKRIRHDSDQPGLGGSPSAPSRPVNEPEHATSFEYLSDSDEEGEMSRERPRYASPKHQEASGTQSTPIKRKRALPWLDPDYPYQTKRSRIETSENQNTVYRAQRYDGLRYYKTEAESVTWNRFGVLLGELSHFTIPKRGRVLSAGNTNAIPDANRSSGVPSTPQPPPAPTPNLTRKQRQAKERAKAKRNAKKPVKIPPKFTYKKEVQERYRVYANFNHNMRFVLMVIPATIITSTEYERMDSNVTKENPTAKKTPVVIQTKTTEKVHFGKQLKLNVDQFDLYIELGRMVWEERWKAVFERGIKNNARPRKGENVGEGLAEMPGLLAVMRTVMGSPPPHEKIAKRIRCYEATGKF